MLPVYKVTSFIKVLEKGGRTKPWVVTVDVGGEIRQFVLKFFDEEAEDKRGHVVNEVLGYALAKQFDLPIPQAALIECDPIFIQKVPHHLIERYEERDKRIKFGIEYVKDSILYDPWAKRNVISRRIKNADTIFAFDNLIRNRDRNHGKPNLLLHSDGYSLIDHEMGFEKLEEGMVNLANRSYDSRFASNHIFYQHLKNAKQKTKNEYFEMFREYLNYLSVNELDSFMQQLKEHGYTFNQNLIRTYLTEVKRQSAAFVTNLKAAIQ
jgi:hypothetical protein